ncbi:MAG: hypothetical protein J5441_04300 [Clostridia bacterium]|nr:hypothetical protein [Clostridia bacterium]
MSIYVISGHYGSGKTNISINLAYKFLKQGSVAIFDLDVVNPYFRTADFTEKMRGDGITVVAPVFANTNLDTPALTGEFSNIYTGIYDNVIVDVGGDDSGAFALGQYAEGIAKSGSWQHWYVVNFMRTLTLTNADNIELMREIENAGKLPFTGIINNTNLGAETTAELVRESVKKAKSLSEASNLPLLYTSVDDGIECGIVDSPVITIKITTKRYW